MMHKFKINTILLNHNSRVQFDNFFFFFCSFDIPHYTLDFFAFCFEHFLSCQKIRILQYIIVCFVKNITNSIIQN